MDRIGNINSIQVVDLSETETWYVSENIIGNGNIAGIGNIAGDGNIVRIGNIIEIGK